MKPTGHTVGEEQTDTRHIPFRDMVVGGRGEEGSRERFVSEEHSFIPAMHQREM